MLGHELDTLLLHCSGYKEILALAFSAGLWELWVYDLLGFSSVAVLALLAGYEIFPRESGGSSLVTYLCALLALTGVF
jgi:hypothetical protein